MKAIKLTSEQLQRSFLNKKMNHVWLYSKYETEQRTHNNSIFLGRTIGEPFACLVVEWDGCVSDEDIEKVFGKGSFMSGGLTPDAKKNVQVDAYYVKGLSSSSF
jgi:hypothetical protein